MDYSGGYVADDRGRNVNGVQSTSGSTQTMTWTDSGLGRTWVETGPAGGIVDTSITDANGATTTEAFDSNGQLTSITTPTGREIAIGYDNNNRVASITQVTDTANGTGPTTTLSYQPAPAGSGGQYQVVLTNPAGYSTTYLDAYGGQAIKVTDANGHTRSSTYTPDRNPASATDALGQVARLAYDLNNNLTKVTLPSSNGTNTAASTSFAYSTPTSVSGGAYLPSSLTDPQGNCSAFVYDPAGNLTASYAGQAGACSGDTAGVASTATYQGDAASGGGTVSCGAQPGEACSTTNAKGATTTYGYDSTGELSTISAPSPLGATTISYDADSRVTSVTDGNGATTTYTYDANNDITKVSYPDGTSVSYTYNADGLVTSRTDATGTTTYGYDSRGLLGSETLPSGEVLSYTYDAAGNLASYTDAGGRVTYGYDPTGNLISLTDPTGAVTHYSYNADNQLATVSYPDGVTQASSYNNAGQVTSIVATGPSGTLASHGYSYAAGSADTSLLQSATNTAGVTTSYAYDSLDRLSGATNPTSTYAYGYDPAGNMTSRSVNGAATTYSYNAANQLTSLSGAPALPGYDANGNMTTAPSGLSLAYHSANQTTSATPPGQAPVGFAYAGLGQAVRTKAGSTTFANSSIEGLVSASAKGSTTYFTRTPAGALVSERTPSGTYYPLTNDIGSVIALAGPSGNLVDTYTYSPYGTTLSSSGTVANPFGFAGGYYDASTGLYHFGARYYDPALHAWTQQDSLAGALTNPLSLNRYIYAGDNPVNFVDPSGYNIIGNIIGVGVTILGSVSGVAVGLSGFAEFSSAESALGLGLGLLGISTGIFFVGIAVVVGATIAENA